MKTAIALAAAVAFTCTSATFAQSESGTSSNQQSSMQSSNSGENSPQHEAQEFVKDASSGNNMEIQASQYIAEHTQNPETKQFAQMMIQDHQRAEKQLQAAAQQAGIQVPDQLTPVHQAMLTELKKKSGKELDRDFAFSAIADHHKDILEFTYASQHLAVPQLKQYASMCIPVLKKHLQSANDLAQTVANVQDTNTASNQ